MRVGPKFKDLCPYKRMAERDLVHRNTEIEGNRKTEADWSVYKSSTPRIVGVTRNQKGGMTQILPVMINFIRQLYWIVGFPLI